MSHLFCHSFIIIVVFTCSKNDQICCYCQHAHVSRGEVIGLLGGTFNEEEKVLKVGKEVKSNMEDDDRDFIHDIQYFVICI